MIKSENLLPVGKFAKTHGLKGEINIDFDTDFDIDECRCIIVDMDGIFVPFFIDSYRFRNDITALLTFDGIDTEEKAREFFGKTVYVERQYVFEDDENSLKFYIGYSLVDENGANIGAIADVDESTANALFVLNNGKLIPVAAIEIVDADHDLRKLKVVLPDGLLDLDN